MSEPLVFFHTDNLYGAVSGMERFETSILGKIFKGHSKAGVLTGVLTACSHPVRKQVHV